jgi:hypothetical protein
MTLGIQSSSAARPSWRTVRATFDVSVLELVQRHGPISAQSLRTIIGYEARAKNRPCSVSGALQRLQSAGLVLGSPSKARGSRTLYRAAAVTA